MSTLENVRLPDSTHKLVESGALTAPRHAASRRLTAGDMCVGRAGEGRDRLGSPAGASAQAAERHAGSTVRPSA